MEPVITPKPAKLLDQLRERIRYRHYSIRTEEAYVLWAKRYIHFHGMRHPSEMGKPEIERFLSFLVGERNVAVATQNQALSALLFLYREVLGIDCALVDGGGQAGSMPFPVEIDFSRHG